MSDLQTTVEDELRSLENNLDATEGCLQELASCLQKERSAVVLFDIESLIAVVQRKQECLETLATLRDERLEMCRQVWAALGRSEEMAESVPTFLRIIADAVPHRAATLSRIAADLESLLATVRELEKANRSVVSRASRWVNRYLGQLTGSDGRKYDARGQLSAQATSTIRRTI
jgi:flagellar biosynthesis/type III secretory pathway chaperone